jgi:hypothetical protein
MDAGGRRGGRAVNQKNAKIPGMAGSPRCMYFQGIPGFLPDLPAFSDSIELKQNNNIFLKKIYFFLMLMLKINVKKMANVAEPTKVPIKPRHLSAKPGQSNWQGSGKGG